MQDPGTEYEDSNPGSDPGKDSNPGKEYEAVAYNIHGMGIIKVGLWERPTV